jgi:hypothetical protein
MTELSRNSDLDPLVNVAADDSVNVRDVSDVTNQATGETKRITQRNLIRWVKGVDIASATALPLGADGNAFDITGTTTITSISTIGIGTLILLHFDAILTLTHHATDLILPGGNNITTVAGDEGVFYEYDTGKWRCVSYLPPNVASVIHGSASKATPVDADELGLADSAASWVIKKLTWANLKATLKTYFDTLYNKYVHPNHSGEVTSVADGAQTITNKAVTLAKMADMATASLLGRNTAATGAPEVLSKATAQSLLNVEDNADVTDAVNVGSSIHGVANKATPVNADKVPLIDTVGGNVLKTSTWTNIKAFLKTYFDTLYAALAHKARHENGGADEISVVGLSGLLADDQHVLDAEVQAVSINSLIEDTAPQLGGFLNVGEFGLIFDSLLSADGEISGFICNGVLGCTGVFGDIVYLDEANQRWKHTDADAEATAGDVMLALILAPGNDGDTKPLLLQGFIRRDSWNFTSYGHALFVSCTAGDMTATKPSATGDIVRVVGYASTFADQIYFNPSGTWLEIA